MKRRSRQFAVTVVLMAREFRRTLDGYIVAKQLIKSAMSTAANYRAACRARTSNEFASKIGLVCEEADETQFWLEIALACEMCPTDPAKSLLKEASELTAIFTTSRETAKRNLRDRSAGLTVLSAILFLALLAVLALLAFRM